MIFKTRNIVTLLLLLNIFLFLKLYTQENKQSIQVKLLSNEKVDSKPRQIVTGSFEVFNNSDKKRIIQSKTILPDQWKLNSKDEGFALEPGDKKIALVSIFIPQSIVSNSYEIKFLVQDSTDPSIVAQSSFSVFIEPKYSVEISVLERPKYVLAGEKYISRFLISNKGNTESKINLNYNIGYEYIFKADTTDLVLKAGESKSVSVLVETDSRIKEKVFHYVIIQGKIISSAGKEILFSRSATSEIFPLINIIGGDKNICHSLPIAVTLRGVTEEGKIGFQADIEGIGSLYENSDYVVDLFLRGPNIEDKSTMFWYRDEYRLSYIRKNLKIYLGDRNYSLSPLTDGGRFGFGGEINYNLDNLRFKVFQQTNRWVTNKESSIAAQVEYIFKDSLKEIHGIGINFLNKNDLVNSQLFSAQGFSKFLDLANVDFEFAMSKDPVETGIAYRANLSGVSNLISYNLSIAHGSPLYRGSYRDMNYRSGNFSLKPINQISLNVNYAEAENNIDMNPLINYAARNRYYSFGISNNFLLNTSLTYRNFQWEDRMNSLYVRKDEVFQFAANYSDIKLGYSNLSIEYGKSTDLFTSNEVKYQRAVLSITPNIFSKHVLSLFSHYYDAKSSFIGSDQKNYGAGVRANLDIAPETKLSMDFQLIRFSLPLTSYNYTSFGLKFEQWLFRTHKLTVNARGYMFKNYYSGINDRFALMAEYRIPLEFCISRKPTVGNIKGRVFDAMDPSKGISKVELFIDGLSTTTDENGNYRFENLKEGDYFLELNKSSYGAEKTTTLKLPVEVAIKGGEDAVIDIGLAPGAEIRGKILVYDFEEAAGLDTTQVGIIEKEGLQNCSLILKNGRPDVYQAKTDADGKFKFTNLPPGKWNLKIVAGVIPDWHYYEYDSIIINLNPADQKDTLIRVLPKKRPIKIITKLDTTITEIPTDTSKIAVITPTIEKVPIGVVSHQSMAETNPRNLTQSTSDYLDRVYETWKSSKSLRVKIVGHTDESGTTAEKQTRSQLNAEKVRQYLIGKGIPRTNILIQAEGSRTPLVPNTSEQNRRRNRRVDITVQR